MLVRGPRHIGNPGPHLCSVAWLESVANLPYADLPTSAAVASQVMGDPSTTPPEGTPTGSRFESLDLDVEAWSMRTPTIPPSIDASRTCFVSWLHETQDLSPHTIRAYNSDVLAMIRFLGSTAPMAALDETSIYSFFEQERARGICPSSLRRRACGLRRFCFFLEQQEYLDSSPWPSNGFTFRRTRSLPRDVPGDDLARLIAHLIQLTEIERDIATDIPLRQPNAATNLLATSLLITTGLRVAELVTLRAADVDVRNRTIHVMGKGRRERVVYLTNDWITHLASAYLLTRESINITHDRFFFNTLRAPLSTASMRTRLAKAATSAGLQRRVTPHMLRHSAATQLIESGVDIRFVQRLLGHASLATTELYTHVTNQALRHAVVSAKVLNSALKA